MFTRLARQAWDYIDAPLPPHAGINRIQAVTVFLKYPQKGVSYTKGEMRWGIAIQLILTLYMLFLLIVKAPEYSLPNLVISWWLMVANFFAMVSKVIIFYHFVSIKKDQSIEALRSQMTAIFAKRIYTLNVIFTGICLVNYICSMPISLLIWKYDRKVPDLFIYSLIFVLRYFYSMYRYSKYFMETKDPKNPYGFFEFTHGDPETLVSFPKLQERSQCSICLKDYKPHCKLVVFPCGNDHYFHLDCMYNWVSNSLSCPLCRKGIFKE